jgi:hypothetical protein
MGLEVPRQGLLVKTVLVVRSPVSTVRLGLVINTIFLGAPDEYRYPSSMDSMGERLVEKRGMLRLSYTMEHGIWTNSDFMEKTWVQVFYNNLRVQPEDQPILFTESPFNPKSFKETITSMLFEYYNVPALSFVISSPLPLYASGRTTGVVLVPFYFILW